MIYRTNVGGAMAKEVKYTSKCGNEVWELEQRTLFQHKTECLSSTKNQEAYSRAWHGYARYLCKS
jgi:hypothetical protein